MARIAFRASLVLILAHNSCAAHLPLLGHRLGSHPAASENEHRVYLDSQDSTGFKTPHVAAEPNGRPQQALLADALRLRGGHFGLSSVLPPVVALVTSVVLKQVILALLLGVWTGCLILSGGKPVVATLRVFDRHLVDALADRSHAAVLLFTFLLGGTIGLVQKAGGGLALGQLLQRFMKSAYSALLCTWSLAGLIFFDDYSSLLIVGNSLRPVLPALRVAPERFAFVVHVMAVCLASLSPVSSWVGLQIGYVADVYKQLGLPDDPFVSTMRTLPYRFFPVLLLALVPILLFSGREAGPMAQVRAPPAPARRGSVGTTSSPTQSAEGPTCGAADGDPQPPTLAPELDANDPLSPKPGTKLRAINALLPFGTIVVTTFAGMLLDGASKVRAMPAESRVPLSLVSMLSECDSINALVWASAAGWLVTLALVLAQGILSVSEAMEAWMAGMKDVLEPCFVLLLAWALGEVVGLVRTADFLAGALHAGMPRWALPTLITVLAHAISYACGSSFGTMAIILPLVGPLAMKLGGGRDYLLHCIGSVLGGAVFGNICSPISDTTILTVLATKCDLQAHVRTITPYTLVVATIALGLGSVPVGLGIYGPMCGLAVGTAVLGGLVAWVGKPVNSEPALM
mmetsp:Transcript_13118/g.28334  ORF Transcript_13118/g.28334 Transcript_13118/m.28334 type:complete len:630 (-) Transcript_13118:313-2202(-)